MKPELAKSLPIEYRVPLQHLHTFGLDVLANKLIRISDIHILDKLLEVFNNTSESLLILGGGSNMLFRENFSGLVIKNEIRGIEVFPSVFGKVRLRVGAGETWHNLVQFCLEQDWGGIENLSLIPGSVGAAPIQNIGAYGVELKDVFESLEAVELSTGKVHTFDREACQFGYRNSYFKQEGKGRFLITRVELSLTQNNHLLNTSYGSIQDDLAKKGIHHPTIQDISEVICEIRQQKLPDPRQIGNAGSFFKNPIIPEAQFNLLKSEYPDMPFYKDVSGYVKIPAAWLIQTCGWKGHRRGDCGVHSRQALVLVNHGGASGAEIYQLSEDILQSVEARFSILLEREVQVY